MNRAPTVASMEDQDPNSTLLTVRDVAKRLNVSQGCVYALLRRRKLAAYRIGRARGAIRVRQEDLDDYLDTCRIEKNEQPTKTPRVRLKHLDL